MKIESLETLWILTKLALIILCVCLACAPLAIIGWRVIINAWETEQRARIASRECPPSEAGERLISSYFNQDGALISCRYAQIDADYGRASRDRKPAKK